MIFKKGDVYRNKENKVLVFVKEVKADKCVVTWSFKVSKAVAEWQQPRPAWEHVLEGPNGYIEYSVTKPLTQLAKEVTEGYLDNVSDGQEDKLIMDWIPQHAFLG